MVARSDFGSAAMQGVKLRVQGAVPGEFGCHSCQSSSTDVSPIYAITYWDQNLCVRVLCRGGWCKPGLAAAAEPT